MKNIGLVSGPVRNCGIHTYASCVYEILKHSTKYKFHFFEVNTAEEMLRLAEEHHITSIIYKQWTPI